MPLDTVNNCREVIHRILYAEDQNRGGFFLNDLLRWGLLSDADIASLQSSYATWKTTHEGQPSSRSSYFPQFPDKGPAIHGITTQGGRPFVVR